MAMWSTVNKSLSSREGSPKEDEGMIASGVPNIFKRHLKS
jgi:hypothetical protein